MRKLGIHEFISLDGVIQAPGGEDEDTDGGFTHGGWTRPYWHDDIGKSFGEAMQGVDAFLLGRKTYVTHAEAFEPMPAGHPFGDLMNTPAKYVVSKTLEKPIWRNTTVIRDNVIDEIKKLKASAGGTIMTDGSSQLVQALIEHDLVDEISLHVYPLALGRGKRAFPDSGLSHAYKLAETRTYPTGVVLLRYTR
jgi:dihydrofolate reductase